jgi:hypothetical protein
MSPEDAPLVLDACCASGVAISSLRGCVANRFQFESMRIEPVSRTTVFPVLGKLAWLVQDDGLTSTCPLVRAPDDRPARDQEREVMEAGPAA